jgi:hypothetical protein
MPTLAAAGYHVLARTNEDMDAQPVGIQVTTAMWGYIGFRISSEMLGDSKNICGCLERQTQLVSGVNQ